jgi:hypothetical protein
MSSPEPDCEWVDADWRSTLNCHRAIICSMSKDPIKKLSPLSPARLEEREWQQRTQEEKKTKKTKAKTKREHMGPRT